MKKSMVLLAVLIVAIASISTAHATAIDLYLDTAPNAYGSPDWATYLADTYADIYSGTFVNQQSSNDPSNIGTLNYAAEDYLVYSFGDLGNRLHSFYYITGETVESLNGRFQVSIEYYDDGIWYNPYEEYGWGEWLQPSSWVNYDGNNDGIIDGVMGSMGNAYWGAYGYTTDSAEAQAALALDLQYVEDYIGDTRFFAKLDGEVIELRALHTPAAVPEPTTMLLLGVGMVGLVGVSRKLKK